MAKRIMILGAGLFQLAAIRKAAELGYHVVTVDYLPDSVGHRYGHRYVDCSTADREAVRAAAEELSIDGIFSMGSDIAVPTVAHVAAALGLRGPPPRAAETLTDKERFRQLQESSGLDHPRWSAGTELEALRPPREALPPAVVVKPADTSGSRGVAVVAGGDGQALRRAFDAAAAFSRSGRVCVEEYIAGEDVSADGLLLDGRVVFVRFTHKHKRGFVVTGHRLPGPLSRRQELGAAAALGEHFDAAGYREGPFDADLRIGGGRTVVLETSPRLGGNGMPLVIARHTGVDLVELSLRLAMGEPVRRPESRPATVGCGVVLLAADRPGRLLSVAAEDEVRRAVPAVSEVALSAEAGMAVHAHRHGGDTLGYAVFDCRSQPEYDDRVAKITSALRLSIEPPA